MSKSDRSNRTASLIAGAFCAVFLFAAAALIYPLGFLNGREAERRQQTPASYSKSAQADAKRACARLQGGAAFECIYEKVEASQEQARAEQDLSAQQRAADSALASAVIALLTLAISIVGVWFVKRTLDATLDAVQDTSRATAAMEAQNLLAAETAHHQLRAYILPKSARISGVELDKAPRVDLTFSNSGATMAHNVDLDVWFDLFPMDISEDLLVPSPVEGTSKGPMGPHADFHSSMTLHRFLDTRLFEAYETGDAQLICFGKVTYETLGEVKESGFRFTCRADKPGPEGEPAIFSAALGNYAT